MSVALTGAGARERVLAALGMVIDPELDEPITDLGFVEACEVDEAGDVEVVLRLPTPQCAPNFAFLMAADARRAVAALDGVRRVSVRLGDHYTAEEINAALERGDGFTGAFPGETGDDELDRLRETFQRKALLARQARVAQALLEAGHTHDTAAAARLADLPEDAETRRCRELRSALSIDAAADAPAFVLADGAAVDATLFPRWLRMGRLIATSLEANGGICRSLLAARFGEETTG